MIRALVLVAAVVGLIACSDDKAAETPKPETVKAAVDALPPAPTTPPPVPVPPATDPTAAATTPPPAAPAAPAAPAEKGSGW